MSIVLMAVILIAVDSVFSFPSLVMAGIMSASMPVGLGMGLLVRALEAKRPGPTKG